MFGYILKEDKSLCRDILETILDISIDKIEYIEDEKHDKVSPDFKEIRLDIKAETKDAVFDIEMQAVKKGNLLKRARYYQTINDAFQLKRGDDYKELNPNYVIFICADDFIGTDEAYADFRMMAELEHGICERDDGRHIIFLAASLFDKKPGLAGSKLLNLLQYIHNGTVTDSLTEDLAKAVKQANESEAFKMSITYESELQEYKDALKESQDREDLYRKRMNSISLENADQAQQLKSKDKEIEDLKNRLSKYETIEK